MPNQNLDYSTLISDASSAAFASAAMFDVSDRTQIEITGADRARFLHNFTSNDIKRLQPGQGCETFVTSLKGKVVAHVFVFCTSNSLWLDGFPEQKDAILSHLGKYVLIDDVQLIPRSSERGELYVTGPIAGQLLQLDENFAVNQCVSRESAGDPLDIRRVDLFEPPGFLLSAPVTRINVIKQSFGALGIPEGSQDLFQTLRINAGYPAYGVDVTADNLAQEVARTKQSISFNKGCYLGQETIARIDAVGHTNQELRRIQLEGSDVPAAGTKVLDTAGATEVGVITSAAPRLLKGKELNGISAIALMKRIACPPGTKVSLNLGERSVTGEVQS